MNSVMMVTVKK
jgi:hypothetical protein